MKKVLISLMCVGFGVVCMGEAVHPGMTCRDLNKIETAKAEFAKEKKWWSYYEMQVLSKFVGNEPKSFLDIEKAVDSVEIPKEANLSSESNRKWNMNMKKTISYSNSIFVKEAWEFCKKNPTSYDFHFVYYRNNILRLSDKEVYDFMVDFAINNHNDYNKSKKAIELILDTSLSVDRNIVKTDLQKLNSLYSRKLLKDKDKYEFIVAELRTVLDTF